MEYTQNTVAKTFKVYAGVNFVACLLLLFIAAGLLNLHGALAILWIATSIVINVGIYAIGEVIQLLDDIKQNTAKAFLTRLLAFLFDNYPMEYMRNEDECSMLNNAIKVYFETGENRQNIKMLSENYRKDVYNKDDIDEVFLAICL